MKKIYRKDYSGEWVIARKNISAGNMWEDKEWVPNTISNTNTGFACVIGNGTSRKDFDLRPVINHQGGHLGKSKLETYGCNALYRNYAPDFLIVTSREIAKEISVTDYAKNNLVLTRSQQVRQYPNMFHLIPYDTFTDAGTTALRVACFDGHSKIYLLGFDGQHDPTKNNNIYAGTPGYQSATDFVDSTNWINHTAEVINTYSNVDFVRVMRHADYPLPEAWKYCTNLRTISFRDFVIEADL